MWIAPLHSSFALLLLPCSALIEMEMTATCCQVYNHIVQLEMKQEFWNKRKEYARRVGAANTSHFRKARCQRLLSLL
jgi:hypothetical protein